MKDKRRTKAQLLDELAVLRRRAGRPKAADKEPLSAKKALEDERAFIEDALNSLIDVFYVLAADGRLLRWNKALKEVTGYGDEELSSMTVFDFFEGEDIQSQHDFYHTLLEQGQAGIEAVAVTRDGRRIPYYFHSTMLRDPEGEPLLVSGVGRDMSEQKKVREELEQYREHLEELVEDRTLQIMMTNERLENEIAEREVVEAELRARNDELETFAHTISHDLRSSVAVIKGYAQVARDAEGDLLLECLAKIIYLSERMNSFIVSLLAYSEAGRPEGKPEEVRTHELLQEVVAEREAEIRARNIELEIEEDLPTIRVDPVRIQQVFINLLDNAIKYIGDNPAPMVKSGARQEEDAVVFYVADNGPGIMQRDRDNIFKPFERLGNENHFGLGIGLSTVKRAVEGWGGRVWVESAPGEGCTFYFSVPSGAGECP